MTKTFTEQWREGTLPAGCYYVLSTEDDTPVACDIDVVCDFMIRDVVEPVPSYDEFKQLVSKTDELVQKIHILNEQNTKQYNELCEEIKKDNILEKKLAIATKALKKINKNYRFTVAQDVVYKALKEMKGVK